MQNHTKLSPLRCNPLSYGSLFSGIGGMDLGFDRAGMICQWQVEIDPFARAVLAKHWPEVPKHDDIRTFRNPPRVDIITGGFPCQDISSLGLRAGIRGERSGLFWELMRVVREAEPRYVVLENVAALLFRGMGEVLQELAASGYDAEWDCLPAAAFGAHFRGDRIFIVAHRTASACLRRERRWTNPAQAFEFRAFKRLVDHELRVCVPSSKNRRVSDGLPFRAHRIRGLGNAVVPQVAEYIAKRIIEADSVSRQNLLIL
jgi:DNA (cytosine-5)-methyltransferase 1